MKKIYLILGSIFFILIIISIIIYRKYNKTLFNLKKYHIYKTYNIKTYNQYDGGINSLNKINKIQRIPKKIHQTYKPEMDVEYYETCMINKNMNPEYEYIFYDDNDILGYIKENYPQYMNAYNMITPYAYKADLFRYFVLYKEGGVYIDCKSSTIFPLRDFISNDIGFVSFKDRFDSGIQISFIASVPYHPILKKCIDMSIDNILNKRYGINTLDITGPQVCGRVFNSLLNRDELSNIEVGLYKNIDAQIIGHFNTVGKNKYEVLTDKDRIPLLSRSCGSHVKNKSNYVSSWHLKSVYL